MTGQGMTLVEIDNNDKFRKSELKKIFGDKLKDVSLNVTSSYE